MSLVVSASSSVWSKKKVSVGASQSVTIDSVNEASFIRAHYKIAFRNASGTLVRVLDYDLHKVNGQIVDRVYGKSGEGIAYTISSSIVAGRLELVLVNNETFDLAVGFARILIDA